MHQASGNSWTHTFTAVGTYRVDWYVKDPGKKAFDENDPTCKDSGGGTWDKCGSVSVKVIKGRWNPTPTVFTLNITEPDSGDYCTAGETLACSAKAEDTDTYIKCGEISGTEYKDNIINWEWTASKGTISASGPSATYTPPPANKFNEGEQVTITVSAEDEAKMDPDDGGSRKDGTKTANVTITLTKKVRVWSPTPDALQDGITISSPSAGTVVKPEQQLVCSASATDLDQWYLKDNPDTKGKAADEISSYEWSASVGTFPNGNTGQSVVWQAPAAGGLQQNETMVSFTVTVKDKPLEVPEGDEGSRGQETGSKTATDVVKIKKDDDARVWDPGDALWVAIQSPAEGQCVCVGSPIWLVADGGDKDHWKYKNQAGEGTEVDEVTYKWKVDGAVVGEGKNASWTPNVVGQHTIEVTADDRPLPIVPPDEGNREDGTESDTRTVTAVKVEILEPNEDPPTDVNFGFDNAAVGVCNVAAQGTTGVVEEDINLQWAIDPVGNSVRTSVPNPPTGPIVTFTFTGLPANNADFGPKDLVLSLASCKDTQVVKIFFTALATNHPWNITPNWYYYWTQALNNGPHIYNALVNYGRTVQPDAHIEIGANAYTQNGIPRHPNENYIDAFGIIVSHEQWHRSHRLHNINVHGGWNPPANEDIDGDVVCDREPADPPGDHTGGWEAANGTDPNNPTTHGIEDKEWIAQQNETDPNASALDWAFEGSQWHN